MLFYSYDKKVDQNAEYILRTLVNVRKYQTTHIAHSGSAPRSQLRSQDTVDELNYAIKTLCITTQFASRNLSSRFKQTALGIRGCWRRYDQHGAIWISN